MGRKKGSPPWAFLTMPTRTMERLSLMEELCSMATHLLWQVHACTHVRTHMHHTHTLSNIHAVEKSYSCLPLPFGRAEEGGKVSNSMSQLFD